MNEEKKESWSVSIKGDYDNYSHEICVEYGNHIDSWGWHTHNGGKIRISAYSHGRTNKTVWNALVRLAHETASMLNESGVVPWDERIEGLVTTDELSIIMRVNRMCYESCPPDAHGAWELVRETLIKNRGLK